MNNAAFVSAQKKKRNAPFKMDQCTNLRNNSMLRETNIKVISYLMAIVDLKGILFYNRST